MKNDFKFDKDFPPEYDSLQSIVGEAKEQIRFMDELIQSLPNQGPPTQPENHSFLDNSASRSAYNREKLVSFLRKEKFAYQRKIMATIESKIKDADPKIAQWIRESAGFGMKSYPEKDGLFAGENKYFTRAVKDKETPQYDMDVLFPVGPAITEKDNTKKETITPTKVDKSVSSMSMRFGQGLSYTKAREKSGKSPEPGKDIDQD